MPVHTGNGVDIYYEIHGQGKPLVLIHGLGSSTRDWELQIPALASIFQVIALDLRGHGRSDKAPGPYSMVLFAGDIADLIRALEIQAPHLVGISLGGMVAFQIALDYPRLVRSLVVINSTPELVAKNWKDRLGFLQRQLIIRFLGMEKMGKVLADRFLPDPGHAELRQIFVQRWAENHRPSYLASLNAVYGWSVTDRLGEITSPTLVIGADGDYFPTADKEAYTKLIPGARLTIIENARHALPAEKPDELNQIILDFLVGLP